MNGYILNRSREKSTFLGFALVVGTIWFSQYLPTDTIPVLLSLGLGLIFTPGHIFSRKRR